MKKGDKCHRKASFGNARSVVMIMVKIKDGEIILLDAGAHDEVYAD